MWKIKAGVFCLRSLQAISFVSVMRNVCWRFPWTIPLTLAYFILLCPPHAFAGLGWNTHRTWVQCAVGMGWNTCENEIFWTRGTCNFSSQTIGGAKDSSQFPNEYMLDSPYVCVPVFLFDGLSLSWLWCFLVSPYPPSIPLIFREHNFAVEKNIGKLILHVDPKLPPKHQNFWVSLYLVLLCFFWGTIFLVNWSFICFACSSDADLLFISSISGVQFNKNFLWSGLQDLKSIPRAG